jgi:TPP-dependent indolepyruvate ferredoxin oxidoreductase alpha subunit
VNNKKDNFKEKEIKQDELESTSGGNTQRTGTYYIDQDICAPEAFGCNCAGKCLAIVNAIWVPWVREVKIFASYCTRCGGCIDHNWCTHGAIKWSRV